MKLIIWVLFLHWIADFVFQTDQIAINKSKSWSILLIHSIEYATILWLGLIIVDKFNFLAMINLPAHFITDAITSRITSYLYKKEERHWFFVVIGLDQFLHYVVLLLTIN